MWQYDTGYNLYDIMQNVRRKVREKTVCDNMWQYDTPSVMGGVLAPLGIRMHPDDPGDPDDDDDPDDPDDGDPDDDDDPDEE